MGSRALVMSTIARLPVRVFVSYFSVLALRLTGCGSTSSSVAHRNIDMQRPPPLYSYCMKLKCQLIRYSKDIKCKICFFSIQNISALSNVISSSSFAICVFY
ncbi:Hypothetical protein CINCED_3A021274 [Cinara cedri]|uniref:Uncharacterized protein n=1 Tax=Cinara cedri TaxID=506608 RepID=A0A5E4M1M7_9HEMI|nr:Hypothetical protein CINCED_3A021274 [Cinara cedri]